MSKSIDEINVTIVREEPQSELFSIIFEQYKPVQIKHPAAKMIYESHLPHLNYYQLMCDIDGKTLEFSCFGTQEGVKVYEIKENGEMVNLPVMYGYYAPNHEIFFADYKIIDKDTGEEFEKSFADIKGVEHES